MVVAAETIGNTQAEQLRSDGLLAPLALFTVWDELLHALREAVKRLGREKELASRAKPKDGSL